MKCGGVVDTVYSSECRCKGNVELEQKENSDEYYPSLWLFSSSTVRHWITTYSTVLLVVLINRKQMFTHCYAYCLWSICDNNNKSNIMLITLNSHVFFGLNGANTSKRNRNIISENMKFIYETSYHSLTQTQLICLRIT